MTVQATEFSRSWIMSRAWHYVRIWRCAPTAGTLSRALKYAWGDMKARMQGLRLTDELSGNDQELAALEAKEFTTAAERDRIGFLRTAVAHEKSEGDYAEKRGLIEAAPCTVTFIKADGTRRIMRTEPGRLIAKGDKATRAGQRATKTRKARHPNLLPVWDAEAQAPRSVNLATVTRVVVDGSTHEFRAN
ncbi:hypothetical protein MAA5396_04759 [Marinovum algicola]|uniref:Uncharacterized protein n=1 Tax=Marinovum algicola TaxID=42444 RepID=A0A975WEL9_9RHOB|nr:hypothetical protein [Marinovum algicola]SEK08269.1 hypothetical protein SAMN04487940_12628 [Marinovum algicola]SLN76567.1 hypothetical protein MAA5396_04759 [Marinovum algicola]